MKKQLYILFVFILVQITLLAQAPPQGINYQAMVYVPYGNQQVGVNSAGQIPANNAEVNVTFAIENGINGPLVYEETHLKNTDTYGLLTAVIGTGNPTNSNPQAFNQINWGQINAYLRVTIILTRYNTEVGSYQKLWSVPYAFYTAQANSSTYADTSRFATVAGNGITGVTDNGNGTLTFNYYDGSTYTTGQLSGLTGPQGPAGATGPQGATGANGLSAYEIWLQQGNTGTQTDFLNSITGPQGATGLTGAQGPQGPIGPQGATGPQGPAGNNGTGINNTYIQGDSLYLTLSNGQTLNAGNLNNNADSLYWKINGNTGTNSNTHFIGTNDTADVVFKTNGSERIRVTKSGNVGIGNNNPNFKIHINGSIANQASASNQTLRYFLDNNSQIRYQEKLNFVGDSTQIDIDPLTLVNNGNADIRYFRTTNTSGFKAVRYLRGNGTNSTSAQIGVDGKNSYFQNHGGNFGVGTSTPTEKIELQGGGIRINGNFGIGFNDQTFNNPTPNGNEGAKIYFDNTIFTDSNRDFLILEKKDGNTITPDGGIIFANRGNDGIRKPTMLIDGIGNIGIGTITPQRPLHISDVMRLEPHATAPSSPGKGDMYFDSTLNKLRVYDGTVWQNCW